MFLYALWSSWSTVSSFEDISIKECNKIFSSKFLVSTSVYWNISGFTIVVIRAKRETMLSHMCCLGSNKQALVLQWFCLWAHEKAMDLYLFGFGSNEKQRFTKVLLSVKRKSNGVKFVLLTSNEQKHCFTCVLLSDPRKKQWMYNGVA